MSRRPPVDDWQRPRSSASLGHALDLFLKKSGLGVLAKYPAIQGAWDSVVGPELSGRMRISSFRRGVLEIAVDSSALLTEVGFFRGAILEDIRQRVKKPFVSRISFVLGPMEEDKHD